MPLEQERIHQSAKRYCFTGSMNYEGLLIKQYGCKNCNRTQGHPHLLCWGQIQPSSKLPHFQCGLAARWHTQFMDTRHVNAEWFEVESNSFVVHVRPLQLQFHWFSITSCRGQAHDWSLWSPETKRSSIFQLWFWSKVRFGSFTFLHSEKANNYWKTASCIVYLIFLTHVSV